MEEAPTTTDLMDQRIAGRLRQLRLDRGWSLDDLARLSGISRATLSRLEHADVSPTASILGKLCAAHGLTMSRLIRMAEETLEPLVSREVQPVWRDPDTGFVRRSVSPPARALAGEVIECQLPPGSDLFYASPPRPGLEHHLVMLEGELLLTADGVRHHLSAGDCLRYQLNGASRFVTPAGYPARYFLFMV